MAYLARLPGARDTLIGNANTDATAWMYAVADLHPLWTHYDYPMQQGPGISVSFSGPTPMTPTQIHGYPRRSGHSTSATS
ncbi:transmembrane alanine and leucine rich domain protein [Mycobacterium xenopi 3993]|nr:transmembrane alanine and leucine rich domain protein [Mycobacterium xenopi 3993]